MACAGTFLESQVASPRAVGRLLRSPRMGPCAHRVALACAGRRNGARTGGFLRLREAAKSLIHLPLHTDFASCIVRGLSLVVLVLATPAEQQEDGAEHDPEHRERRPVDEREDAASDRAERHDCERDDRESEDCGGLTREPSRPTVA